MALKHVGRYKNSKKKLIVAYRTLPNDPYSCLVIPTESITADEHDALMKVVESNAGQTAYEFAEAMMRSQLPDGRNMLVGFHQTNRMMKVPTADVEMVPDTKSIIGLDALNQVIADQKGIALEDLALKDPSKPKNDLEIEEHNLDKIEAPLDTPPEVVAAAQEANNDVLSDEELAAKYRSDADRMFKEAKRLREQAEELVPTKKKVKSKESAEG